MSRQTACYVVAVALLVTRVAQAEPLTAVLPSGRLLTPVGTLAATANFPNQIAVTGSSIVVLDGGASKRQSLRVFDAADLQPRGGIAATHDKEVQTVVPGATVAQGKSEPAKQSEHPTVPGQSLFQGLTTGPDGTVYVTGGDSDDLLALRWESGKLQLQHRYALQWQQFPRDQYPYQYAGDWSKPRHFYPDSVAIAPDGRYAYVAGLLANNLARVDLRTGHAKYLNVGSYPFAVILADGGRRLVVSDWGGNGVTVVDRERWRVLGRVSTGPTLGPHSTAAGAHPTALAAQPGTPLVWVADSNLDRIVAVDTARMKAVQRIDDSPYRGAPPGAYPSALAIAAGRLFVANAGNNDVAVYDLSTGRRLALIPTGWYPTALAVAGNALYVASSKGMGSGPNLDHQWVGDSMQGLLQRLDLRELTSNASEWTGVALRNDGFDLAARSVLARDNARATAWLRAHIRHVVFILRENKTFDQELGAYAPARRWADPELALYGPKELPNLFTLADRGALFVDFYADGEVTSQGHQWTTAGSDSDFVQRTWPLYYSDRGLVANSGWTQSLVPGAKDARDPHAIYQNLSTLGHWSNPWISYPGRLFLFNDLLAHGVSFEDFGEFASRNRIGDISPAMRAHLAVDYPAWDRMILDTDRAAVFERWVRAHAAQLPTVLYIWLPDDHTAGRAPCLPSPASYVADNDEATARVIHALSKLPDWKNTLVLLTEDDAQSGADHVDAHRTFALAAGPWVKPGTFVTRHLSQVDLLRTIEAVAGIPPMSQWDANAHVLAGIWRTSPDLSEVPVQAHAPLQRNPGVCEAGSAFSRLPVAAVPGASHVAWNRLPTKRRYRATTLMTIAGPEQMRQQWLAVKGPAAYAAQMRHLRRLAAREHRPLSSLIAGAHEDDD